MSFGVFLLDESTHATVESRVPLLFLTSEDGCSCSTVYLTQTSILSELKVQPDGSTRGVGVKQNQRWTTKMALQRFGRQGARSVRKKTQQRHGFSRVRSVHMGRVVTSQGDPTRPDSTRETSKSHDPFGNWTFPSWDVPTRPASTGDRAETYWPGSGVGSYDSVKSPKKTQKKTNILSLHAFLFSRTGRCTIVSNR